MHPDEYALKLTHALNTYDLDSLVPLLRAQGDLTRPPAQARANLKPIFAAAQADQIRLLHPPPDFHTWLRVPLLSNSRGGAASSNTIIARTSTLRALYAALRREHLITHDPLTDFTSPPAEHARAPLPPPTAAAALISAASDPALHAALTLIYRHAMQVTELLGLRWGMYDHARGQLLRRRTRTTLDPASAAALEPLLRAAGGPLHAADTAFVLPYRTQDDLRLAVFRACQGAGLPFVGPSQLRRCGLRDFPLAQHEAGYTDARAFELARALAQALDTQAETPPTQQTAPSE